MKLFLVTLAIAAVIAFTLIEDAGAANPAGCPLPHQEVTRQ